MVVFPLGIPQEERSNGILVVDAVEQFPYLRLVPDVFTLKLRNAIPSGDDIGHEVRQRAGLDLDLAVLLIVHSESRSLNSVEPASDAVTLPPPRFASASRAFARTA